LTDKELIIKALEYLRGKEHTSLVDFWKSLGIDDNKRDILKIRLEKNGFVTPHPYIPYGFMLTAFGLETIMHPYWVDKKGNIKLIYANRRYDVLIRSITYLGLIPIVAAGIEIVKTILHHYIIHLPHLCGLVY